jgi:hypothetical protein
MRFAIALVFSLTLASAQVIPQSRFAFPSTELIRYFDLTESQVNTLRSNQSAFNSEVELKESRRMQLWVAIIFETAKMQPDPSAIGVRYVEMEMICRQINDERKRIKERQRAVLTPAQILRLDALEEALRLVPLANNAISGNLLEGTPTLTGIFPGIPVIRDPLAGSVSGGFSILSGPSCPNPSGGGFIFGGVPTAKN